MVNGYSAQQLRAAEAPLLAAGEPLMRRAAHGLALVIAELLPAQNARVLLPVGSGDNGGDALFAGAELASGGATVEIVATGQRMHGAGLAAAVKPVGEKADGPGVVAVDIPSGIHPDTGAVPDETVLRADVTVTFGAYKAGLVAPPASTYAGSVRLIELGLDFSSVEPLVVLDN